MTSPASHGPDVFVTVAEIAKLLRVSKMTVYRLVHSGALSSVTVGRSYRVPRRALQEYMATSSGTRV